MNIKYIKKDDDKFPKLLKELPDCPDILYAVGNTEILNEFSIAVIGSRNCTSESLTITQNITRELCLRNVVIISGLAIGIDSIAHRTCIEYKGRTIAILGSGLLNVYPKQNSELLNKILENGGCILSEYLPYDHASKIKLHNRNRIIAGLSNGIIIIQAREKSGSLITANYGKKYKKKLLVVPGGYYDENYAGSNRLICEGASCIMNIDDIAKYYPEIKRNNIKEKHNNIDENLLNIYKILKDKKMHIDEISFLSGESIKNTLHKLSLLEMQGKIIELPGKFFVKR